MKKGIFFIFLFVSVLTLQAQNFGVKAGFAQSWLRGKELNADSFERRNGGYVGAYLDIIVNSEKTVVIQPEVIFSTEGGTIVKKLSENAPSTDVKIHSSSLRFPVLVKIRPFPKWTVEGGPQVTYRFSGESVNVSDVKLESLYKSVDFGFDLGATYYFSTPFQPSFFIQVRWTNNFLKMLDTSKIDTSVYLSEGNVLRSSIGQIGVGYRF